MAIAVPALHPSETITCANLGLQRLTGRTAAEIEARRWRLLAGAAADDVRLLREAVCDESECSGEFTIQNGNEAINVDAWSNTIDDDGCHITIRRRAVVFG
jgi:hypothetical protein